MVKKNVTWKQARILADTCQEGKNLQYSLIFYHSDQKMDTLEDATENTFRTNT